MLGYFLVVFFEYAVSVDSLLLRGVGSAILSDEVKVLLHNLRVLLLFKQAHVKRRHIN